MRNRKLATTVLVATVSCTGCILLCLLSFLGNKAPQTVSDPSGNGIATRTVAQIFRQGWGFFTRDAREDIVRVAHLRQGRWVIDEGNVTSAPDNAYGLSRHARNFDQDLSYLLESLPDNTSWSRCRNVRRPASCEPTRTSRDPEVSMHSSSKALCGELLLIRQPPVPLAFARFRTPPPGSITRAHVLCTGS
ncbi:MULTISPECIES: SdpA family antimicrobial peptide system protein [unclassified Curtobacterium]|uniref:SdpA family antimicrobial peptide system protein n=1 Tax=unclassified Curtobacterium TaxID=257496 RepID=UPI0011134E51